MRPAALLLALPLAACSSSGPPAPALELVETAPVETSLDDPDLPETHEVWLDMLRGARRHVELAHFYASNREGSRLEAVVRELEEAAERGVDVRFLAEERFYSTYPDTLERLDATPGIEVRRYDMRALTGGVMHAKYFAVDGREAYLGSANFDWRALEHIQELGVRTSAPGVVDALGEVFDYDWILAGGGDPGDGRARDHGFPVEVAAADGETVQVRPVFSPRGLLPDEASWDLPHLVRWIDGARAEVSIQLLTYRSVRRGERFGDLEDAMLRAAERGVAVRLLVADWGKRSSTLSGLQRLQRVPGISVRMVTLPQASSGFIPFARVIHAKYMVVDGRRAWLGTSNWEGSYFHAGRNAGLLIEGEAVAGRLARYFAAGWGGPYAYDVEPDAVYEVPRIGY